MAGNFTPAGLEYLVKNFSKGMSDLGKLDKAQQNLGKSATDVSKKFTGLGKGILSVGAIAGGAALVGITALGAGVGALGVASVKTAISFESAFAGVLKTTDGLTDSMGNLNIAGTELREGFVDLSKEVPLAFEELAAIGELGGQLGIGRDALIEFTESVAALGVSTNLSTEEAASGLARMSNIFNISAEDIGGNIARLGSSIVDLGNNFATTERDILAMAERLAGAGAIAGLTQADILGIGAAMSSVGVQAEAGGTAVQKVLLAINNAVVGTTTGFVDNTEAIEDNVNRLTSLNGKLVALESKAGLTGDQILQMRDEFIAAGGSAEEFGRQLGATERRQLFETAIAVRDLKDETQLLRDLQGTPIDAGQLEKFASVAGLAATDFEQLWKEDASQAFQLFVEGLGKQGDEAINTLDELGLTDQRLIRAFLSLSGAGDLLGDTLDTANSAFEDNTALADEAAKRYATTESQLLIFKNTIRAVGDAIGSRFLPILNRLLTVGKDLINEWADPIANAIDEKIIPAIEALIALGSRLITAFQEGGIGGLFAELGTQIQSAFTEIQPMLAQLGQRFLAWITETAIPFAQEQLPILFNAIIQFVNENWPRVVERLGQLSDSFFDWVNENVVPRIPEIMSSIISGITSFLSESWPQIQETLSGWGDLFWEWVQGVIDSAGETLAGIIASIGQWALSGETQQQLIDFGMSIGENLVVGIQDLISDQDRMISILTKIATGLIAGVGVIAGLLIIVGSQIVAGILEGILNKITGGEFEAATFNELRGVLEGIGENLFIIGKEVLGENLLDGLIFALMGGIQPFIDALIALVDGGIEGLKSHLGIASPSAVFAEFGKNIIEGLISGIQSLAGNVIDIISSIFGGGDVGGGIDIDLTLFSQTLPDTISTNIVLIEDMMAKLQSLATALGAPIQTAVKKFQEAMMGGFILVSSQLEKIITAITLMITKLFPELSLITENTTTEMEDALGAVAVILEDIESSMSLLNTTMTTLATTMGTLATAISTTATNIDTLTTKLDGLKTKLGKVETAAEDAAEAFDSFTFAKDRVSELKGVLDGIVTTLGEIISQSIEAASALSSLDTPPDLLPGSPSPFERSLMGINTQLVGLVTMLGKVSSGFATVSQGATTTTTNISNQIFNISFVGGNPELTEAQSALMIRQSVQRQLSTV